MREVHRDELHLVVGLERLPAGEHLEEDHARGVDVGAGVDDLGERLLGRQVLGRPEDHARLREGRDARRRGRETRLGDLGDAEVEDLDDVGLAVALDEHDVVGLEVAVDDARGVRVRRGRAGSGGRRRARARAAAGRP